MQLLSALERQLQQPAFAEDLARSQADVQQQRRGSQQADGRAAAEEGGEVLSQDWWQLRDDGELRGEPGCVV